jgi:hypothetical protein
MDFFANQLPSKFRLLLKKPIYYLYLLTQLLGFPLNNIVPNAAHNIMERICKIGQNIVGTRLQLDINQSGGYLSTRFAGKIYSG